LSAEAAWTFFQEFFGSFCVAASHCLTESYAGTTFACWGGAKAMTEPSLPEESIFARALEIGSPAERAAFLDRACGQNPALRAEVEALLGAHGRNGDLLDLLDKPAVLVDEPITERPGTIIGPYKLLQQIGEGGMGNVFMAEQTEPMRRKVALKIIKPGMDSRQIIARFEAERQALALMDHPHIARVFEAGTTKSGRPYFVMELVKGTPITRYCDERHLTPRQRLQLLLPVCTQEHEQPGQQLPCPRPAHRRPQAPPRSAGG
jgi:hypothetical protein